MEVVNTDKTNNKIEAISESIPNGTMSLTGYIGYDNGVNLLNDLCNQMYGNTSKGISARNLNIEDIQNNMDLNVWNYNNYNNGRVQYGATGTDKSSVIRYPYQFTLDKNGKIDGVPTGGTMSGSEKRANLSTQNFTQIYKPITVQQTAWMQTMNGSYFKKAKTRVNSTDSNFYYNMFVGSNISTWLSSRCANVQSHTSWGLFTVKGGTVNIGSLAPSYVTSYLTQTSDTHPIITIPINSIDINSGYNDSTGWSLK